MSIRDQLFDSADHPMSKADLVRFIAQLAESMEREPDSWENITLTDFLESWSAWLAVTDESYFDEYKSASGAPQWQMVADMLLAAGIYE